LVELVRPGVCGSEHVSVGYKAVRLIRYDDVVKMGCEIERGSCGSGLGCEAELWARLDAWMICGDGRSWDGSLGGALMAGLWQ